MAITTSRSTSSPQAGNQIFLKHFYNFDSGVAEYVLDRGLMPASTDIDADRVSFEPRALDHEENTLIYTNAEKGYWHPTDNPNPIWDQSFRTAKVAKLIIRDAAHIHERFNGVVPPDGQYEQFKIIWEDPLLDGRTAEQIAASLGIDVADVQTLKAHYQLIEDAVNRNKFTEIQSSSMAIQAIEFDFDI